MFRLNNFDIYFTDMVDPLVHVLVLCGSGTLGICKHQLNVLPWLPRAVIEAAT